MKPLKQLAAHCAATIEDYDLRVQLALGLMDRMRCPLSMADGVLYDEMCEAIGEWGEDNEVNVDNIDVEDVLYERTDA